MSKRVLSINENTSMNYLLQTVLFQKYWLICVNDVLSGMHQIRHSEGVDLIIVDIDYEKKENIDFIHHVKTSYLYNVPLIVLANGNNKGILENLALQVGIDKTFFKPFSPIDLCHSIDQLLLSELIKNI